MKKIFLLALTATAFLTSCKKDTENDKSGIFKGPVQQVHHGKAWTWVQVDKQGVPERVALSIDNQALNSLPIGNAPSEGHNHQHENNIVLKFHPKADVTPFRHLWLNWNPSGHEPENIYGVPHFDIHYYMVTSEERETYIDPVKLDADPHADYIPANHLGVHPLPKMGKHFIDLTSPELDPVNPQPFTQTFIFGSYDRNIIFYEPMITLDFLKNTSSFERSLPVPAKFQKSGYYPTKMRVVKQNGVTDVILEDMVYRTAS